MKKEEKYYKPITNQEWNNKYKLKTKLKKKSQLSEQTQFSDGRRYFSTQIIMHEVSE